MSIFSATMALQTAYVARHSTQRLHRHVAIATGAIALGGGIWTMHFIGMLAFDLCLSVDYSLGITALSIIPALAASWVALSMLSRARVSMAQLLAGGVLMGAGIGTMHYTGMAAMRMSAVLRYDPLYFALSILVAVVLATISLGVRFKLQGIRMRRITRLIASGSIMGLAICGMHYTGMSAARFIGSAGAQQGGLLISTTFASLALSMFTITVTVLVTAANGMMRYKQTFQMMKESESRIRAIVETAVDGIITIDSKGTVQAMNRSAERLFGWSADEVLGKNIKMLMPEPDQSSHDGYLRNFLTTGFAKVIGQGREVIALHKNGKLIPVRLAVGQVDLPGTPLFVGFVTDISERRALEASLREVAEKAEQAAAAKTTFLANMSHEIRTPMNAVIGFSELLLKSDLSATQRAHLTTVHQSARSLLGLLNDILDTTKLEKGGVTLEHIDFSLQEVAQQIVTSLRLNAEKKRLDLVLDYASGVPEYFKGDPLRIQQVLTNLVGNAIKFTQQGSVRIAIAQVGDRIGIEVWDTGIGMTPEQLSRIFDPFAQADASISRRFGGTGLGTTIARQLIELMDGTISAESQLGAGSVFRVTLSLAPGEKPAFRANALGIGRLPALNVLIADDVPQNVELLTLLLEEAGHTVTAANDGTQAIEMFFADRYDLVLMDVHMPNVDGLEATRRIRVEEARQGREKTPVIALTASVMESDRKAAQAAGMNGFASKPFDIPKLRAEIARVLKVAPGEYIAVGHQDGQDKVIDWARGELLWRTKERMAEAIFRFLADMEARHPLPAPGAAVESVDWALTAKSLHGIRGAAANLGLLTVANLSGILEQGTATPSSAWFQQLQALRIQLDLVKTLLQEEEWSSSQMTAAASSPVDPADIVSSLEKLSGRLQHGELDEDNFDKISNWLLENGEAKLRNEIHDAIESFDFESASEQLKKLMESLKAEQKSSV
ncbi:MHYT domain-containing protein [Herbaspirillum chlorophenolicum]|uniref:MHYT domain-containing protein n=2 Tax=Herbaspirillum chlorophenolicum TaxID=211589 RepID=UPI001FD1731C|nr:MHYT domain-containing protein [Herbaspirillum chlorophenolicum]